MHKKEMLYMRKVSEKLKIGNRSLGSDKCCRSRRGGWAGGGPVDCGFPPHSLVTLSHPDPRTHPSVCITTPSIYNSKRTVLIMTFQKESEMLAYQFSMFENPKARALAPRGRQRGALDKTWPSHTSLPGTWQGTTNEWNWDQSFV